MTRSGPRRARLRTVLAACVASAVAASAAAQTVRSVPLPGFDVAYDALRGDLWASVPGPPGGTGSVVPIDPRTGVVGAPIAVSDSPGRIAISHDGAWLYVSHHRSGDVHRIDLATRTVAQTFTTGTTLTFDLDVHPTDPLVVAVARGLYGFSGNQGVAIFDAGVRRPDVMQAHTGPDDLAFDASGGLLFGYDSGVTSFLLRTIRVDAGGATQLAESPHVFQGFWGGLRRDGDRLLNASGQAVDTASLRRVGRYPHSTARSAPFVDPANDAVYFVALRDLEIFDRGRFTLRSTLPLPQPVSGVTGGAVWGPGRLAFQSDGAATLVIVDLELDASDGDGDGVVDAADDCPSAADPAQGDADGDGEGDVCDAQPSVRRGSPVSCTQERARGAAEVARLRTDVAACLAVGSPDADADGEPDVADRCPGTPGGAPTDAAGCSAAQFCAAAGSARCVRADFRNDEPTSRKPGDCAVVSGACVAR